MADTFIAMPNGPVPSTIFDFIRGKLGQSGDPEAFTAAIDTSSYPRLKANRAHDASTLSGTDIECLDDAIAFCRPKSFGHLSQLTHQERSWVEANANMPMDYELFIDHNNPNRAEIIADAREFALYGVL